MLHSLAVFELILWVLLRWEGHLRRSNVGGECPQFRARFWLTHLWWVRSDSNQPQHHADIPKRVLITAGKRGVTNNPPNNSLLFSTKQLAIKTLGLNDLQSDLRGPWTPNFVSHNVTKREDRRRLRGRVVKFARSAAAAQGFAGSHPGRGHDSAHQATSRQCPTSHN